jgi:hypothetical protein
MSKSHDSKKSARKQPQRTLMEKRQAKHDKKNRQGMIGVTILNPGAGRGQPAT